MNYSLVGELLNIVSPKIFNIIKFVLDRQLFFQRMIARDLDDVELIFRLFGY